MYLRCVVIELWIFCIYIVANYKIRICVKTFITLKSYAVMLRLVSDIFPMLKLYY